MNLIDSQDSIVRLEAFNWLERQVERFGEVLPRSLLARGFIHNDRRVPLVAPQGIFKPAVIPEIPLTITTSPKGPYNDSFSDDGLLAYRYRGNDPYHRENVGLRTAMQRGIPLIYFHGILPSKYLAVWPVYIVGDQPQALTFTVAVEDANLPANDIVAIGQAAANDDVEILIRRKYVTAQAKARLHQHAFRERVLSAYRDQCALCRLKHRELLDAAHIIPDSYLRGEPRVSNGLSLCKLHHAAFDRHLIGIRPNYTVVVRQDLLDETDGPMLKHGLQGMHESKLILPSKMELRPESDALAERFEEFRRAV